MEATAVAPEAPSIAEVAHSAGLYVAAVSDVLDGLGYHHRAMNQRLRPLLPDRRNCGFVGRA